MYGPRFRWKAALFIVLLIFLITAIISTDIRIKSSLLELAKARVQVTGMENINRIVNEKVVSDVQYGDMVSIHKDAQGKIVLIQPNTIMLNKIMSSTVLEVSHSLGEMQEDIIGIPIGQLTGSDLLAAYGPKIKVKTIPAGQVQVNVLNKFEQAGINQTRHLIYFEIKNKIKIAVPFMAEEVEVMAVIPLAETIIVGEVPQTYVNFRGNSEMLYPLVEGNNALSGSSMLNKTQP